MNAHEYKALTEGAGVIDFSARGRLCLVGADRQAFLHGQVTNNVKDLAVGQGCYAALANNKGKMTCDLNIFVLADEILLDFEPGLSEKVKERLEKFIIADDVQLADAAPSFGLLSVIGPGARAVCAKLELPDLEPGMTIKPFGSSYAAKTPRLKTDSVDIFHPRDDSTLLERLKAAGAVQIGTETFEIARVEQGIPRFGADMDENTLVPEAIEHAISYTKGCYIGQEVIARIRTYGQVAKALRGLSFEPNAPVPSPGDKILKDGKEVGWITSAVFSPKLQRPVALGYVRKECNQIGTQLLVNEARAAIVPTPFA